MIKMNTRNALLFAGTGLLAAGSHAATITPVEAPSAGELSHEQILEQIFGVELTQDGVNFEGGGVVITRVDDDNDQSYDADSWSAEALGSWALAGQSFGTATDGIVFDVTKQGPIGSASGSATDVPGGTGIHFGRFGNECDTVDVTTDAASNPNGKDHVVTYTATINGQPVENTYFLFFEDANETSDTTDWDYNDLVVELTLNPVPEPGSMALIALGGLAMLQRRRRN